MVSYVKTYSDGIELVRIFLSITIINYLRVPFIYLNIGLYSTGEMHVALKRLDAFFQQPDTPGGLISGNGGALFQKGRV